MCTAFVAILGGAGCSSPTEQDPVCEDDCFAGTPPVCRGTAVVTYDALGGECFQGTCVYPEESVTECPHGCADGACVDPCAGVVCNTPPTGECEGNTFIGYEPTGTCDASAGGTCAYTQAIVDCAATRKICDPAATPVACVTPPPACDDGTRNGTETDADCGGEDCLPCDVDDRCSNNDDCASGVCTGRRCKAPTCADSVQNGTETGVDCGVSPCRTCPTGQGCTEDAHCRSATCIDNVCTDPTCTDERLNGNETDVDCGGPACAPCPEDFACKEARDCETAFCSPELLCRVATCEDETRNADETDADCGGLTCDPCGVNRTCAAGSDCTTGVCTATKCVAASCTDGVRNGTETGVDCGGASCGGCATGSVCAAATDCESRVCNGGRCAAPSCTDGVQASNETDVDCGGACPPCIDGLRCRVVTDCESFVCTGSTCREPTCDDDTLNQDEVDVDCAGPNCDACDNDKVCNEDADCASNFCDATVGRCKPAPTCTDRILNAQETAVDCGGPTCPTCANGATCGENRDCRSNSCVLGRCSATIRCDDRARNGEETDVDCGGPVCAPCGGDADCLVSRDCASTLCVSGTCSFTSCGDDVRNGNETDTDCGGDECVACLENARCIRDGDCEEDHICVGSPNPVCTLASCFDGVQNRDEIARDCGGVCGSAAYCVVGCTNTSDGEPTPVVNVAAASSTPGPGVVTFRYRDTLPPRGTNLLTPPTALCGAVASSGPERVLRIQVPAAGRWRFTTLVTPAVVGQASTRIYAYKRQCELAAGVECHGHTIEMDLVAGEVVFVVVDGSTDFEGGLQAAVDGTLISTPTCNDLVRNQGETGIDCGGPCAACPATCPTIVTPITLSYMSDRPGIASHSMAPTDARTARYNARCASGTEAAPEDVYQFRAPQPGNYTFEVVTLGGGPITGAVLSIRSNCATDTLEDRCALGTTTVAARITGVALSASSLVTVVVDSTSPTGLAVPYVIRAIREI